MIYNYFDIETTHVIGQVLVTPFGFTFGSPRDPDRRGSHISIRHPEGYRINRALIEEMNVIPDFRAPDNLHWGSHRCILLSRKFGKDLTGSNASCNKNGMRSFRDND